MAGSQNSTFDDVHKMSMSKVSISKEFGLFQKW